MEPPELELSRGHRNPSAKIHEGFRNRHHFDRQSKYKSLAQRDHDGHQFSFVAFTTIRPLLFSLNGVWMSYPARPGTATRLTTVCDHLSVPLPLKDDRPPRGSMALALRTVIPSGPRPFYKKQERPIFRQMPELRRSPMSNIHGTMIVNSRT
jgi:hypothetical protein